ncbi:uncharacterized protein LOC127288761 [Leptopilina boulardi]|uniref:uncharacterized protein LOC127288761 n=1 Tax=Leptopilina boulardi TaxID=63433 RepID=UPI0021F5F448|nr:uncharacterized protein LOC127288761 [Leptopilina boulardi]
MADRGFVFIPVNDPLRPGGPDRAQLPNNFKGRFGDSSHPGAVAEGQRNFTGRILRLPEFIRSDPSLWFAQVELIFESAGIFFQRSKAGAVVTALDYEVVQTFGDLLTNNNFVENLYSAIKKRVIENFSISPEAKLRSILKGEVIGEGKRSLILSRIRHLGRGRCNDKVLKAIFLEHLPANCRTILAISDTNDLSRLASMADRMVSYNSPEANVAAISADKGILTELEELTSRIDALSTRSRNPHRYERRERSKSRSRFKQSNDRSRDRDSGDQGLCRLHRRYEKNAHRCYKPCSFKENSKSKQSHSDDSNSGN